jgi:hypothetical protein
MLTRKFVREFQNQLSINANQKSAQLAKGQCATLEQYKQQVGYIAGLEAAGGLAESLLRQIEDAERESGDSLPEMPGAQS